MKSSHSRLATKSRANWVRRSMHLFATIVLFIGCQSSEDQEESVVTATTTAALWVRNSISAGHENAEIRSAFDTALARSFKEFSNWRIVAEHAINTAVPMSELERQIGDLNVRYLLTTQVVVNGNQLTITVRLIDAHTADLAAEGSYFGAASEPERLASDIAEDVDRILDST